MAESRILIGKVVVWACRSKKRPSPLDCA